ncbi:MAG: glycosyltransferase family 4 protein [Parvularculaceae bacterium]
MKFLYSHKTRSADGQYVHIRELTKALAAQGHEIVMAAPGENSSGRARPLDARAGAGGLRRSLPGALYERAEYLYSIPAYLRLRRLWGDARPDALYERYSLFYHAGVWLKRSTGAPMLLEVNAPLAEERARHDGLTLRRFAARSEAAIWRAADMVLPVTGVLADKIRAAGVDDDRIAVIHNGAAPEFLQPANPAPLRARYGLDRATVLGFAGFVRDWHRVDRVIRFMAERGSEDLRLLLVGDGPARAGLELLACDLGVADRVIITGVVQREAMPDHIALFDAALLPAAVEYASPLKLFEYMAMGRAILAPRAANICEVARDGEDALLFAPEDDAAFYERLAALCANADLRARLGAAARETLERRDYTWAGNASRIEALTGRLLALRAKTQGASHY